MSYSSIYALSSQAMEIEKLRVDLVAHNIANQYTLQKAGQAAFQASSLIVKEQSFESFLEGDRISLEDKISILPQKLPPNKVYQPGHPAADKHGFITYPGLSSVDEMTTLLKASRSYEAQVRVLNVAHTLFQQALTIGEAG